MIRFFISLRDAAEFDNTSLMKFVEQGSSRRRHCLTRSSAFTSEQLRVLNTSSLNVSVFESPEQARNKKHSFAETAASHRWPINPELSRGWYLQQFLAITGFFSPCISKASGAFFAHDQLGSFHGQLNPLSSRSLSESCVMPVLMFGSEFWHLNITLLSRLESFQAEFPLCSCDQSRQNSTTPPDISLSSQLEGLPGCSYLDNLLSQ